MFYMLDGYLKNKYYDTLSPLSPCLREAELFRLTVEEMPLEIRKGDEFAGWYGFADEYAPVTEAVREFPRVPGISPEKEALRLDMAREVQTEVAFSAAHTCIDYGKVLQEGLAGYRQKVERALAASPENEMLRAMELSLRAACRYGERFAALAAEKAAAETDAAEKMRLAEIAKGLSRVPQYGAETFRQAVQSVWLMHSLIPMAERSWASISLGRMDQYLYPFYRTHLQHGGTREEAKAILKHLFLLLDSYGDGACAMNIGGMDAQGREKLNELSFLLLEVEKEMALRAPIFVLRVSENTPDAVLDSLIDFDLFKIGQPTFYSEENCRKAVMHRGISEAEAAGFSCNSCMGLILAGQEFADMWGVKFNAHLPLELAVSGAPFHGKLPVNLPKCDPVTDFESLLRGYGHYFRALAALCGELSLAYAEEVAANAPDPLLSALTEGCIENRADRAVGAKYNTVTVETMGLTNTCDALMAIKQLVFEEKRYALGEMIAAAKADYAGYEALRQDILRCRKYGENDGEMNDLVRRVTEIAAEACRGQKNGNRMYLPSLHTIDANVWYGMSLPATLDGRKGGEPVGKNADPSFLLQKTEHTSVIQSAAAVVQTEFSGGQPIDLYFDKAWFAEKSTRDKIRALVRTYFRLGGLQLQVNSVDLELLKKAHPDPEKYPHVIIRKGGYSVRFSELGKEAREEFMAVMSRY